MRCARRRKRRIAGRVPLNAAEGFIRQVLGWREYVRGLYWLKMPGYARLNALEAPAAAAGIYWNGASPCALHGCGDRPDAGSGLCASHPAPDGTGNFALLAGIDPDAINAWYLAVYADAFEWVELPNTHGMAIHADGGIMASKPLRRAAPISTGWATIARNAVTM